MEGLIRRNANEKNLLHDQVFHTAPKDEIQMIPRVLLIIIVASLFALALPCGWAQEGQEKQLTEPLRLGMETAKAVKNIDLYGSKIDSGAEGDASVRTVHSMSTISLTPEKPTFNISQRTGQVGKFSYNASLYRPLYNIIDYSRTKPMVEIPESSRLKPVYEIDDYPEMMMAASIP
jgi:hypothetical protein